MVGDDLICGLWLVEELCIELEVQQCVPGPHLLAKGQRGLSFGREMHQVRCGAVMKEEIGCVSQVYEPFQGPMGSG